MARNNKRCAGLVNKDGVHLINDGVVQPALHTVGYFRDHVVAQIIEAELVIRAVGNVAGVSRLLSVMVKLREVHAGGETESGIKPPHPLRIAGCKVVVHGHHMNALAFKRIQVGRKGCHQCLSLTGAHLRDLALVQNHATHQLDIKMAHTQHTAAGLAADGKGGHEQLLELFAIGQLLTKLSGLCR